MRRYIGIQLGQERRVGLSKKGDRNWWVETKAMIDRGYDHFWAKRGGAPTASWWDTFGSQDAKRRVARSKKVSGKEPK